MRIANAAKQAREAFQNVDKGDLVDAIKDHHNCIEVEVDGHGDVWIRTPQVGHWLSDEYLIALHAALAIN